MAIKTIVTADHTKKSAMLSFIDEYGNVAKDSQGNELKTIPFPYSHITSNAQLFKRLGKVPEGMEEFEFGKNV